MKKILTFLLVLFSIHSNTFSQTANKFEFGGNLGFNATAVASGSQNTAYTSGFNAGVLAEYYLDDSWSIKGKLTYDQKGWGNGYLSTSNGTTIYGVNYHLNYVTVPVMANWHFGHTKNWYLNFGTYAGFLMNAAESSNTVNINSAFNSTDFGLAVGIGVKFRLSEKVKLFIEDDMQEGVTSIFKDSRSSSVQNVRSGFNMGLNFSL